MITHCATCLESYNAGGELVHQCQNVFEKLDGIAVVNLSEPSPGDLERIHRCYQIAVEWAKRADNQSEAFCALYKAECLRSSELLESLKYVARHGNPELKLSSVVILDECATVSKQAIAAYKKSCDEG